MRKTSGCNARECKREWCEAVRKWRGRPRLRPARPASTPPVRARSKDRSGGPAGDIPNPGFAARDRWLPMFWRFGNSRIKASLATQSSRSRQRIGSVSKSASTLSQSATNGGLGRVAQIAQVPDGLPVFALQGQGGGAFVVLQRQLPNEISDRAKWTSTPAADRPARDRCAWDCGPALPAPAPSCRSSAASKTATCWRRPG